MVKGFAAEETKAVFARAAELAAKSDDFSARFATATVSGPWQRYVANFRKPASWRRPSFGKPRRQAA